VIYRKKGNIMATQAALANVSTISVSQVENIPSSSAYASVGNSAQPSLVAYPTGGQAFQPVFNPAAYAYFSDPILNNRKAAFTFWRTDYMDRSWKNSGLGTSTINAGSPVLGAMVGSNSVTGSVEVGKGNAYPSGLYSAYRYNNTVNLDSDSSTFSSHQIASGFNVACVLGAALDNENPLIPITSGPLNNWNGYGGTPLSGDLGVYPGFKGGNSNTVSQIG
jgi:hypothetical protein